MLLRQVFDPYLAQYAYLVGCQRTGEALIIDPERDIEQYRKLAKENGLRITAVTETHIHADFVSGAREFAADPSVRLYLSAEGGRDWTYTWPGDRANVHFLKNGTHFFVGNIRIDAVHTPGHTPEHISFLITDQGGGADKPMALATGDFLFVGDVGRPDLLESAAGVKNVMESSARTLRESLQRRLSGFQDYLQVLPGHGAGSACGKALGAVPTTTLGYERMFNPAYKLALSDEEAFVKYILRDQPDPPLYFATMKRVNRDGIAVTGGVPAVPRLSVTKFAELTSDINVRILDTRDDRKAFDEGHVSRSISAPLGSSFFLNSAGSYLSPDDRIVLILGSEADVDPAVRQLYRIGFDRIVGWLPFGEARDAGLLNESIDRVAFEQFEAASAVTEGAILDVRTTGEHQRGHIEGSLSIPYTRLKDRIREIPKDRRLFVHCASGKRAGLAASFLQAEGFEVVHVDGNFPGACAVTKN
jgi:hydroxyacylglutathione hydrolase